jgi:hypothetical protein
MHQKWPHVQRMYLQNIKLAEKESRTGVAESSKSAEERANDIKVTKRQAEYYSDRAVEVNNNYHLTSRCCSSSKKCSYTRPSSRPSLLNLRSHLKVIK